MISNTIKGTVRAYWNETPCGSQNTTKAKYTKEYFDEIERHRYSVEPEIFSFGQFTRFNGKKVLEVGIGAGTDFLQWVRAGAKAYGIDLTPEAVRHAETRLNLYSLKAEEIRVGDGESIPYPDNNFDLVYSWGVIHHTQDMEKALSEIVRVIAPGGEGKLMLYHRRSLVAFYQWVKWGLLQGRPWLTVSRCLYDNVESIGTKAYTKKEVRNMLSKYPVKNIRIDAVLTHQDRLLEHNKLLQFVARILIGLLLGAPSSGWYLTIQFTKY